MDAAKPTITFTPQSAVENDGIRAIYEDLLHEYGDQYTFAYQPCRAFGVVETLLISIAGSVTSHLIIRLIDTLHKRPAQQAHPTVKIEIVHITSRRHFQLPEETEECVSFFKDGIANYDESSCGRRP